MAIPREILLISEDYFKKLTELNGAVDWNLLTPCVYVAQDKWVAPHVGDALMQRIKDGSVANDLTSDYITLRDTYMLKPIVFWSLVEAIPKLTYKMDNGSIVTRSNEDMETVDDKIMKDEIDRAKNNALFYTKRLSDYLCANAHLFAELSDNTFPNRSRTSNVYPGSTFIISNGNTAMSRENNLNRLRFNNRNEISW